MNNPVPKIHPLLIQMWKVMDAANGQQNIERAKAAADTVGTLRGAMAGAILDDGAILSAKCPRLDQARMLGVEEQVDPQTRVMFAAGFGHENYLEEQFNFASRFEQLLKEGGITYRREERVHSEHKGTPWTGTPDFEVSFDGGVNWIGVEAKSLVSNFTAYKHEKFQMPQMKHVLQVANYMVKLERKEWLIAIGHYFYAKVDGDDFPPNVTWYVVVLNDAGQFEVHSPVGEVKNLGITPAQVTAYWDHIVQSNNSKVLSERPLERELGQGTYDRCGYCAMQSYCNKYDTEQITFEAWLAELPTAKKIKNQKTKNKKAK